MRTIRALNRTGIARFRGYLKQLRDGAVEAPPADLLEDPAMTELLPETIETTQRTFRSRLELGEYLCECLSPLSSELLGRKTGLWAWLSLNCFDEVCPVHDDGSRRPGRDYRHIPDFSYRYQYRHLLLGPYLVFRRHAHRALALLSGPVHIEGGIYQEITSRRDLIANRGVVEAALHLYVDAHRGNIKRGAQVRSSTPGSVRRFVRVLQQLDLTYDIFGLAGRELVDLLPPEFDQWRPEEPLLASIDPRGTSLR